MKNIRFNHNYKKLEALGENKTAQLIQVIPIRIEDLSKKFIDFDCDNGFYPLPEKGLVVLLIFKTGNLIFPTIRSHNERQFNYYQSCVGENFRVLIKRS